MPGIALRIRAVVSPGSLETLAEIPATVLRAAGAKLYRDAVGIMNVSKRLTPIDTGFLRQSGHVGLPVVDGTRVTVTFGYAASYAIYVHENLTARHKNGTQAKFLEVPVLQWKQGALDSLAQSLQAAIALGRGARGLATAA